MYVNSLLEVHSVQVYIKNVKGASKEVYGHIFIDDNGIEGGLRLFDEDKKNAQAISPYDLSLPLDGPSRCIMSPSCRMGVLLHEKHTGLEISNGYIWLEGLKCPIDVNTPVSLLFRGDYGFARVNVSLFKNSIQAFVELVFVPRGSSECTIFGEVAVQYSFYAYESVRAERFFKTRLFEIPKEKAREICRIVSLARQAVCVPCDKQLEIATKLWVNDCEINSRLSFLPRDNGEDTQFIKGNFGDIKVSVTWLANHLEVYCDL